MDKTAIVLLVAIGAMTPVAIARADVASADLNTSMQANSFAELLRPIPNALAILKVADEQEAAKPVEGIQLAQDYHHHHHQQQRYHHHHQQYHHHNYYNYSNHHHHHHHNYNNY